MSFANHLKNIFVVLVLLASVVQTKAQDTIYSHWPAVQPSTFDAAQCERILQILQKILPKPIKHQAPAKPGAKVDSPIGKSLEKAAQLLGERRFEEATREVNEALALARQNSDRYQEMRAQALIGSISREVFLGSSLRAVPYHEAALAIAVELRDTTWQVFQLLALADNYGQAGRYDRMLEFLEPAALLLQAYDIPAQRMQIGIQFGIFLGETGRWAEAETMFKHDMKLARALNARPNIENLFWQLFDLNLKAGKTDRAATALDSLKANGFVQETDLNEARYQLEKRRGNREKAFQYLEQAYRNIGTSYMQRSAEQLTGWETRLRTREKELQLKNQQTFLDQQKRARRWLYGLIGLVTLLLFGSWYAWYQQRQAKRELSRKNLLIEQQTQELTQLDQLKSRFFANVSHELRTPLSLILGPLELALNQKNLNEHHLNLLQTARNNALQLRTFINEILELSKLQNTHADLKRAATVLFDFLNEFVISFQPLAESRQVEIALDFQPEADWTLALDRNKCLKILNNLLSNALKFSAPGDNIKLSVQRLDDELCLQVRDTGSGIHPDDLPHVFERYYQSQRPEAKAEGGTGIGLALCFELVTLMNGRLWVESIVGEGSTFFVRLPVEERPFETALPIAHGHRFSGEIATIDQHSEATNLIAPGENLAQLLIVEDNTELQGFLGAVLSGTYQLIFVSHGQAAIDYLGQADQLPDLILSDLMMPVMDGFTLLENLRAHDRWKPIPVILLTARAERQDRLRAFRIGIDDYLLKPFVAEELLVRIENALRNQNARREWLEINEHLHTAPEIFPEATWLEGLNDCVVNNLNDFQLNVDRVAQLMNMSRVNLYRAVRKETGLSVNQYIQETRLQHARTLLLAGGVSNLSELAAAVGFRTGDYLSRLYRERFGNSPAESM